MMRVRFPLPAPDSGVADIAQLVERTLGKGEVGSSNLPISTSIENLSYYLPLSVRKNYLKFEKIKLIYPRWIIFICNLDTQN